MGNDQPEAGPGASVIGREPELATLRELLRAGAPMAILLTGAAGVGKTTLWEAAIRLAREQGARVLSARPSDAEVRLPFAGICDLFDGIDSAMLAGLPAPQLRALEVALLRADPASEPPPPHAVPAGLRNALRLLASQAPIVVAIDDIHWLDAPSAEAIAFTARRPADGVRLLLTMRAGVASEVERALRPDSLHSVTVDSLSLHATQRMLSERLGLRLAPRVLHRLFDAAHGNPLVALEIGRVLIDRQEAEIGPELASPYRVDNPFTERVLAAATPVRNVLLAVAVSGRLERSQLVASCDPGVVEAARADGLLVVDGEGVRLSHPLLAAAVRGLASMQERRAMQLRLADAVSDENLRVRYLAAGSDMADSALAALVADAGAKAMQRGAVADGVELAEHALRLTPAEDPSYPERLLALAQYLLTAGEAPRVTELLSPRIEALGSARSRARAHLLLGEAAADLGEHERLLELALDEAAAEPDLRSTALAAKVRLTSLIRVERIREAEEWARQALDLAQSSGSSVQEAWAVHALAWTRILRGRPIDELDFRGAADLDESDLYHASLERPAGVRLACRGQVDEARAVFAHMLALADERGDVRLAAALHLQLCELELRAGNAQVAAGLLERWDEWSLPEEMSPQQARCQAMLAAVRGHVADAIRHAVIAEQLAAASGFRWDLLESSRARGIAALCRNDFDEAARALGSVWAHTHRAAVEEPGAFPVLPDLVEALVSLGRVAEAAQATSRLDVAAREQQHPWGTVTARRCTAAIALASGYEEQAVASLTDAAAAYGELGLRFDEARSLLQLGRAARRFRKRAVAGRALEEAAAKFERTGCTGWAELARAEIAALGTRRTPDGVLSPAQRRTAELAASGMSNKEIARRLAVSVHTVEVHLSHAYATLGVRSRVQLAHLMALQGSSTVPD